MRVNIRCCCNPHLILGTVDLSSIRDGQRVMFQLYPEPLAVERTGQPIDPSTPVERLELTAEECHNDVSEGAGLRRTEVALKSDETPLPTLRRIPSFIEVNRRWPIGVALMRQTPEMEVPPPWSVA